MERNEFCCMLALENVCSMLESDVTEYGYNSWAELYDAVFENAEDYDVSFEKSGDDEFETLWLLDEYTAMGDLKMCLNKAYAEVDWVMFRMKQCGVVYE